MIEGWKHTYSSGSDIRCFVNFNSNLSMSTPRLTKYEQHLGLFSKHAYYRCQHIHMDFARELTWSNERPDSSQSRIVASPEAKSLSSPLMSSARKSLNTSELSLTMLYANTVGGMVIVEREFLCSLKKTPSAGPENRC